MGRGAISCYHMVQRKRTFALLPPSPDVTYLELLLGLFRDAALWGQEGGCWRSDSDLRWEFGDGRRDEELWYAGQGAGLHSAAAGFADLPPQVMRICREFCPGTGC